MVINHQQTRSGGEYSIVVDGSRAFTTYSRATLRLIIVDHTDVPDSLRGTGLGQRLAKHVVEEARTGSWKIIPLCPFFKSQVDRHPEWRDVIA